MSTVAYVLGFVALVLIIACVAVLSYLAGKRQAVKEIMAMIAPALEALKTIAKKPDETEV